MLYSAATTRDIMHGIAYLHISLLTESVSSLFPVLFSIFFLRLGTKKQHTAKSWNYAILRQHTVCVHIIRLSVLLSVKHRRTGVLSHLPLHKIKRDLHKNTLIKDRSSLSLRQ